MTFGDKLSPVADSDAVIVVVFEVRDRTSSRFEIGRIYRLPEELAIRLPSTNKYKAAARGVAFACGTIGEAVFLLAEYARVSVSGVELYVLEKGEE